MDNKIASNIVLGVFVLIGLTLFIFLIMVMGGGTGFFSRQFSLYVRFAQVKGLHFGSEVSLSGLRVGTVKDITIAKGNDRELLIQLNIAKDVQNRIRKDSVARISTQGILGDKYVEITIGSPGEPMLRDGDFIEAEDLPDLLTKGGGLVEELQNQFKEGGEAEGLLRNLNTVAGNLVVITNDMKNGRGLLNEIVKGQSGGEFKKAMAHVSEILAKIDRGDGTLGALLNDPTVYEDIKTVLGGAKRSSVLKYFMNSFIESGKDTKKK
jgi:phospholipid/cholesterol/gamma-HCH transport system substrate-binding protein